MKDDDSVFGASAEGLERFMFEAWQPPEPDPQGQPTVPAQMLLEQPGGQIDRYKLLSILGEGGMGIVYLAEQEHPVKRQVALKVIKPGMDSKRVLARFDAEQQALALMEHPHVARVHDAGSTPSGRPYFVMEYVKGVPITEYCDRHRLTIEERLRLFLHVCEAVQHAHQKGIIHRDIKPSNILVTIEDEEAVPKVIDFGVARAISQPLTERTLYTEQGQLVGTPEYMSPEQADLNNQDIDTRTDVYSLGVVLYQLVAGVLPFDPHTLREHGIDGARKVICEQDPQTPSTRLNRTSVEDSTKSAQLRRTNLRQLQRRLRGDLDWITLKAMEKDRARRYAYAGELAADIRRHLDHEAVTAGRPSLAYKARKFVRRNRALVSGFAAVLAVLLAGIIVSLAFAVRAERARHEATAIAEFLHEDVFETFDGWDRGGQQITIKEFLDAASQKVSSKFGDMPLQEASIRKTLGDLYLKVSAFEEAENHLRRSLEIFTGQVGGNDVRTIEVVDLLGQMYWHRWQYPEAEKYLSEVLPSKRRLLGADHPETLETMGWLGWACYGNGNPKNAEEFLTEAYTTAQRTLGDKDRITVECMLYYGCALVLRGRYGEAERILSGALKLSQGVLSPAHPFVAFPTALLGRLYSRAGRYREAEELLSNALAVSREAWGENSGGTFHNVAALAENYARQGLIDDAEKLMLDAVGVGEEPDGPQREISIQNLTYLGFFYLWQKNYDEAERWASKALKASLESNGEGHPITFLPRMALGMMYREQGQYDDAETQFTKLLPISESDITDENVHVANTMHQLAALYQQQGRYAEAEKLHLGVLKIRRNLLVDNHPHTLGTIRGLIALCTAWGKPQEARKWFSELKTAYANQSAAHQYTRAKGSVNYNIATEAYALTAQPLAPCAIEMELDFSYPEPTSEMWHVHDSLHFAHKTLRGDSSITAKIDSIGPTNYLASVGIMIRDTLDAACPHASVVVTPFGDISFAYRPMELAAAQSVDDTIRRVELPHWVRLARKGKRFTAQHSSDGVQWNAVVDPQDPNKPASIEVPMNETVHIGLIVSSHSTTRAAEARMSNVKVTGSVSPDGPFIHSEDISFEIPPDDAADK
jgi:serine/threonine protein kinase/Tfp pilus assembly protein PilF